MVADCFFSHSLKGLFILFPNIYFSAADEVAKRVKEWRMKKRDFHPSLVHKHRECFSLKDAEDEKK